MIEYQRWMVHGHSITTNTPSRSRSAVPIYYLMTFVYSDSPNVGRIGLCMRLIRSIMRYTSRYATLSASSLLRLDYITCAILNTANDSHIRCTYHLILRISSLIAPPNYRLHTYPNGSHSWLHTRSSAFLRVSLHMNAASPLRPRICVLYRLGHASLWWCGCAIHPFLVPLS